MQQQEAIQSYILIFYWLKNSISEVYIANTYLKICMYSDQHSKNKSLKNRNLKTDSWDQNTIIYALLHLFAVFKVLAKCYI